MTPSYTPETVTPSCNETGTCQPEESEVWRTLMAVYLGAILLLSISFNGILCLVFYKKPQLLSISNCFVLNLACCQLCLSIFVLPFSLLAIVSDNGVYTGPWCEVQGFFHTVVIVTIQFTLLIISLDRNYAIMNSLRYANVFTQTLCTCLIGSSWIFSIILGIPPLFKSGLGSYKFQKHQFMCTLDWSSEREYLIVFAMSAFGVPILIQSFCYIKIFKAAVGHTKRSAKVQPWTTQSSSKPYHDGQSESADSLDSSGSDNSRLDGAECKAVRTIFMIALSYSVCWVPYFTDSFLTTINELVLPNLSAASICLVFSSGIINPVIYAYMNRVTRREIGRFLCSSTVFNDSEDFVSTSMSTYSSARLSSSTWTSQQRTRTKSAPVINEMDTIVEETEDGSFIETQSEHHISIRDKTLSASSSNIINTNSEECQEIVLSEENDFEIEHDVFEDVNRHTVHSEGNVQEKIDICTGESVTKLKTERRNSTSSHWNIIKSDKFLEEKQRKTRSNSETYFSKGRQKRKRDYGSFLFFEHNASNLSEATSKASHSKEAAHKQNTLSVENVQKISFSTVPKLLKFKLYVSKNRKDKNTLTVKSDVQINENNSDFDFDSETSSDRIITEFDDVLRDKDERKSNSATSRDSKRSHVVNISSMGNISKGKSGKKSEIVVKKSPIVFKKHDNLRSPILSLNTQMSSSESTPQTLSTVIEMDQDIVTESNITDGVPCSDSHVQNEFNTRI